MIKNIVFSKDIKLCKKNVKKMFSKRLIIFEIMSVLGSMNHSTYIYIYILYSYWISITVAFRSKTIFYLLY